MAYDERLAQRVRRMLSTKRSVVEKPMMGGLTFMVRKKMCVGIHKDDLMVRLDPTIHDQALERTGCRDMDFTGRPMRGFVFIDPTGTATGKDLRSWLDLALDFNAKAKATTTRRPKKRKR
jgi:TfoX/Sxy family transcriptional regulator of competence genes